MQTVTHSPWGMGGKLMGDSSLERARPKEEVTAVTRILTGVTAPKEEVTAVTRIRTGVRYLLQPQRRVLTTILSRPVIWACTECASHQVILFHCAVSKY